MGSLANDIGTANKEARVSGKSFNIDLIRADFPILSQSVHGKPLVYLDNAATTQKPQVVIDTLNKYYSAENSNIHRGVYYLSEVATEGYETARKKVQQFINAESPNEIVFVRGATEAINLVASSFGKAHVQPGDEIIISHMEHHSNIVPWQILCEETGAKLRIIPINDDGELIFEEYGKLLNEKTKLVSVVYVSNSLGTVNPVNKIIELAHQQNIPVLLDAAQAIQHLEIDVQELDCDFLVYSGHKIYGPTGIGVLYAKEAILERMPPYHGGGDMISSVTFEKTLYKKAPHKFEAGTPNIAGAIGLGAALDYLQNIGFEKIIPHETDLVNYAAEALSTVEELKLIGTARNKASVVSFVIDGIHPHDIGTILDREGIAVRTGHHCTQPVMERFGVPATSRASFALYNTRDEVDSLVSGVKKVITLFAGQ
jgi:cysteine desulfurase/selenocysteine lyase